MKRVKKIYFGLGLVLLKNNIKYMDKQQFKNLLAFLFLMSNGETLISKSPDYIIEKAHRYIDCKAVKSSVEELWGLYPTLKEFYDFYCSHWEVQINSLDKK